METPLTPIDFARRARKLYGDLKAVVDGNLRLTYEQFFDRCDRWSATLQGFGVARGDRIAYIAPNTHAQLESFYAVPQIGAVLVPINYRLTPDDFAYLINHSGARIVCAHSDYLAAIDNLRSQLSQDEQFIALEGSHRGWFEYEMLLSKAPSQFGRPEINENDLLTINYTSVTTSRPKRVMITHRNAYMNSVGTLTQVCGLTETSPFITVCESRPAHEQLPADERFRIKARQGVELITSGELRVIDADGN